MTFVLLYLFLHQVNSAAAHPTPPGTHPQVTENGAPSTTLTAGRILCDYVAVREDEITVHKGEIVQVKLKRQFDQLKKRKIDVAIVVSGHR